MISESCSTVKRNSQNMLIKSLAWQHNDRALLRDLEIRVGPGSGQHYLSALMCTVSLFSSSCWENLGGSAQNFWMFYFKEMFTGLWFTDIDHNYGPLPSSLGSLRVSSGVEFLLELVNGEIYRPKLITQSKVYGAVDYDETGECVCCESFP